MSKPPFQLQRIDHLVLRLRDLYRCLRVEPFEHEVILAHLQAHGVRITESGPGYGAEGEGPSQYLFDPEGNAVELKGPADAPIVQAQA